MIEIVKPFNFIKDVFDDRFDMRDLIQGEKEDMHFYHVLSCRADLRGNYRNAKERKENTFDNAGKNMKMQ